MKKFTFLLLLLVSNLILSQTTATPQLNSAQLENVYKGLKQNDYLKVRVKQAEKTLEEAEKLMQNQKAGIEKRDQLIRLKDDQLQNQQYIASQELASKDIEITRLTAVLSETEKQIKRNGRKQLWKGIKIGGISVGVLGTAAALYLISK